MLKYTPLVAFILIATWAAAQECVVPAPSAPPKAHTLMVKFTNPDGGSRPCEYLGVTNNGQPPQYRPVTQLTRCDIAKEMADMSVAKDNGWNDGGSQ